MYQKLNQNRKLKVLLASLAFFMALGFTLALPLDEVEAYYFNFGGKILYYVGPYPWVVGVPPAATYGVCPGHMVLLSFGAPYRGIIGITVPPPISKQWYNFYIPGNATKGAYLPVPLTFPSPYSCPYEAAIPMYQSIMGGSSLLPAY
jgi:hypothetical protein